MADPKTNYVTSEQVSCAVAELKKQGLQVTVRAVRAQIGSGSYSTISRLLKDVSSAERFSLSSSEYLAQFPDRLRALMQSTYAEMAEAARSATAKERREIQKLEDRLRARWAASVREKVRALRSLEIETNHSAELRAELKQATQKIWRDQEIINSLTERLAKAESANEQLLELTEKLKKSSENLKGQIEHFEQQALQQRRADNQMHLLKVAKLEQDLANCQGRVMELSMKLAGVLRGGKNA